MLYITEVNITAQRWILWNTDMELAQKRQQQIARELARSGGVVISALADKIKVSQMTIRRDLEQMEARGLLIRVHGGAVSSGARFDQRLGSNAAGKAKAAKKLAEYLPVSGTIYLDGSTTMLNLVGRMKNCANLQVVTNNAETFARLAALPGVEALLIGGRLDKRTDNLVGSLAMRSVMALTFDAAFFSAFGLDPKIGPTEVTLEDAEVKQVVASRSRDVYLAIDSSKLGKVATGNWHADPERTVLATNLAPGSDKLKAYQGLAGRIV